jgi:hypothetical protein
LIIDKEEIGHQRGLLVFQDDDLMNIIINNKGAPPTPPNPTMILPARLVARYQQTLIIEVGCKEKKGVRQGGRNT